MKNVVNNIACSMAKVEKETEKAYCLTFSAEIYGEYFTVRKVWMPKSQVTIHKSENDTIWFVPNNDWILDAKCKEYCKYVAETFDNVKSEIKTYLSRINSEKVEMVLV